MPPFEAILPKQEEGDNGMLAQWTREVTGKMKLNKNTAKQREEHAGDKPKKVSAILNGQRTP